jgi:hypothetical protein
MKQMNAKVLAPLLLSVLVPVFAVDVTGCKKDEPPPPLPSAAPAATPTPTAPIELVPETTPVASASASASATPVRTGGSGGSSLAKCCSALSQNAQSAPEPNKTYMLQAAAVCKGAAAAGQASGAAFGAITAALRGAGMPTACK